MFKKILVVLLVMGLILPVGVVMAGNGPGGPGGGGEGDIPDTGELYGDLYVILRNAYGAPILDANGCIQPISAVDGGELEIYDSTGTTLLFETTAIAGEPFALAYYTDEAAEIEVACELTEGMLDWVQAVDFGRLNLGRAPEGVIAHAFDEAINKMNAATDMRLDPAGRLMLLLDGEWFTIDAPAENLALYVKMMIDGHWITTDLTPVEPGGKGGGKGGGGGPPEGDGPSTEDRPVLSATAIALLADIEADATGEIHLNLLDLGNQDRTTPLTNDELILAASLLAGAADKTGSITLDKVVYINSIYGINQAGSYVTEEGARYFDFSAFDQDNKYNRKINFLRRYTPECGWGNVWVLQPTGDPANFTFAAMCMSLLTYAESSDYFDNAVRYLNFEEEYLYAYDAAGNQILGFDFVTNVRAFTQASDDALQVLEYIHNYKVPEVLYP